MPTSRTYHESTSYDRKNMDRTVLDWQNQPMPYKIYPEMTPLHLPEIKDFYSGALSHVMAGACTSSCQNSLIMEDLAKILYLANGLTGKSRQGASDFYFRSAPSAGALYPNEIYLVWSGSSELPSGVFHCGVFNRSLTPLRDGNFVPVFQTGQDAIKSNPVAVFVVSGMFFRSAWKYRRRAYRYVLLDAGHVMENLRLAIRAAGKTCRVSYAFDDPDVNNLLGLDPEREVAIGFIQVYGNTSQTDRPDHPQEIPVVEPLPESIRRSGRASDTEIRYQEILDIHLAGKHIVTPDTTPEDVLTRLGLSYAPFKSIDFPDEALPDTDPNSPLPYAKTVLIRRSRRNYISHPIRVNQVMFMLNLISNVWQNLSGVAHGVASRLATGLLIGNVDGIAPGFYLLDAEKRFLNRVFEGDVIPKMAHVCLDQHWLANAGVHFLFLTNLDMIDRQWGARGYRYAMTLAGHMGHAVYLGATALGLGACGIGALYDSEARNLLGLNTESALVYLVAAGPVKRN
ncbi:MAG: SagB/ThcOx family dehydrogenase [Desulfatirhabdiaceae bacterium]